MLASAYGSDEMANVCGYITIGLLAGQMKPAVAAMGDGGSMVYNGMMLYALGIHPSMYLSIHPSMYPFIYLSIHPSIYIVTCSMGWDEMG